ncbi:MAG: glycosyltransferase family 4 protein [Anaerolineae bacterium]|nr:glycosyltransferase family 4 protein [Gloeobacterales cyanobacterium ES-bin-313]
MRILYDGTIFNSQPYGGINRYFCNVIGALPKDWTPLLTTCESYKDNQPEHPNLEVHPCRWQFRPRRISNWLRYNYFKSIYNAKKFDLVHPTYYSLLSAEDLSHCPSPMVLTVWDMIHEHFPEQLDITGQQAALKEKAIHAAQAIICISQNTKKDLLERFTIAEEKVSVVYLASELDIKSSYGLETLPHQPYFLYVGTRYGYKNFEILLQAMAKLNKRHPEVQLCLVGSPLTGDEQALSKALNIEAQVVSLGYANDSFLAKLYRCSVAFIYPSLYEGFGIPPLEAMKCGTVVIASNASSIPEVVGHAGLMFAPHSSDDLLEKMFYVLENPGEREALIQKGFCQADKFSWQKAAQETMAVYQKVA